MKVLEIAFVGYPVTDLKRARTFYEGTLGLAAARVIGNDEQGWVEYDLGPNTIAIGNGAPDWKPSPGGGSVALEVESMADAVSTLTARGYKPFLGPIETPVCFIAVVSDPDGNSVTIHQRKKS